MKTDEKRRQLVSAWSINPAAADLDDVAWLAAELMAANAVIERLPRTKDGIPVTPGMTVWTWFADSCDDGPEPVYIEYIRPNGTYTACYSTEAAARAAEEEG